MAKAPLGSAVIPKMQIILQSEASMLLLTIKLLKFLGSQKIPVLAVPSNDFVLMIHTASYMKFNSQGNDYLTSGSTNPQ